MADLEPVRDGLVCAGKPCGECPYRRDQPPGRFPPERFEALRATRGLPGREAGLTAPIFACHKSVEGRDIACAGWLAVDGAQHLGMRLAVAMGRLSASALGPQDGWPELYSSYEEMAAVNGASEAEDG